MLLDSRSRSCKHDGVDKIMMISEPVGKQHRKAKRLKYGEAVKAETFARFTIGQIRISLFMKVLEGHAIMDIGRVNGGFTAKRDQGWDEKKELKILDLETERKYESII